MQVLTATNADVTISGYSLIANVSFTVDNRPQELDLPSGAYFIWPLRRGTLQIAYTVDPDGSLPGVLTGTQTPTPVTVTVTASSKTMNIENAFHTGTTIQTTRIQEMPVFSATKTYTTLVDNAEDSDY
jgi:hypothetical protein